MTFDIQQYIFYYDGNFILIDGLVEVILIYFHKMCHYVTINATLVCLVKTNNKNNSYFQLNFVAKLYFKTSFNIEVLVSSSFD